MSQSDSTSITEVARDKQTGTEYVVRVTLLDPEQAPELDRAGYHSPSILYQLYTGGRVLADHDPYRLVRDSPEPSGSGWLLETLTRMAERIRGDK